MVVYDARNAALVALERVAGAVCWGSVGQDAGSKTPQLPEEAKEAKAGLALVYDAGSTSLGPHSRGADVVRDILQVYPDDMRICLVSGGLPALRSVAPQLIVTAPRNMAETDRLRAKLESMKNAPKWARDALESIVHAARPAAPILPWLDVGSHQDARSLTTMRQRGYTHVIAVGAELRCHFPTHIHYLYVEALDVSSYTLIDHFVDIVHFLRRVRATNDGNTAAGVGSSSGANTGVSAGARVLVHCYAGMSRSVAAVAAFLVAEGYPVEEALQHISTRRLGAGPNDGFLRQLHQWQRLMESSAPPVPPGDGSLVLPLTLPQHHHNPHAQAEIDQHILHTCLTSPVTPTTTEDAIHSKNVNMHLSRPKQRVACKSLAPHNWVDAEQLR